MDWTEKLKLTLAKSKSGKSKMVKVEANFWALLSNYRSPFEFIEFLKLYLVTSKFGERRKLW